MTTPVTTPLTTPTGRVQRRDAVRNKARVLEAANRVIAESGIDLSLNAIAHEAGVGVGTVYRHFADLEEMIAALLEQRLDAVVAVLQEGLAADDAVFGLRSAVLRVCDLEASDRGTWELLAAGRNEAQRETVRDRVRPLADRLVERAKATGRMRADLDTNDLPMMLWMGGALTSYVKHVAPTLWRRYVEVLLDGFTTPQDGSAPPPLSVGPLTSDQVDAMMQGPRP